MRMTKKIKENNYFNKLNISSEILLDSLTKVISRRYIMSYVTYLASNKIPFSFAILDIDNFKLINDSYGHMIGDKILTTVANIISEAATDNCYIGRYGGDEFIVVFEGDDSYDAAWTNLKAIFTAIRHPVKIDILTLNLTCSAGCSSFPKDGENLEEIFKKSDRLLYRAKTKGRNCFVIYVKEKHQDLEFKKEVSLCDRMNKINFFFNNDQDPYYDIYEALLYLVNDLKTESAGFYEVGKVPLLYKLDIDHNVSRIPENVLEGHYKNNIIVINARAELDRSSRLRRQMEDYDLRAMLAFKVEFKGKYFGYIMFAQKHFRIWQEDDIALIKYLVMMTAMTLYYKDEEE